MSRLIFSEDFFTILSKKTHGVARSYQIFLHLITSYQSLTHLLTFFNTKIPDF